MYEDYMQNFWGYPNNENLYTYDQNLHDYQSGYNMNRNIYEYDYIQKFIKLFIQW